MIDRYGKLVEGKEEIVKVYEDFCKNRFEVKVAKTKEEKGLEEIIREKMKEIEFKANKQIPIKFEQEEIDRAIKRVKCGKARDGEYWTNEMEKEKCQNLERKCTTKF